MLLLSLFSSIMKLFTISSLLLINLVGINTQPEQVHISLTGRVDEMTVTWSTKTDNKHSKIRYGLAKDSLNQKLEGTSEILENLICSIDLYFWRSVCWGKTYQTIHTVTVKGLLPNTKYYYKVGSEEGWSQVFNFVTLPEGNDWEARMIVFGDLGVDSPTTPWLIRESQSQKWHAFFHNGDIAYSLDTGSGGRGDEFLKQVEPISANYPYLVSVGNHESERNFTNYKARFRMPGNSDNMFYTYTVGPILFVVISTEVFYEWDNDNIVKNNQKIWLENVLKEANEGDNRKKHPWIIVAGHRPMYCSTTISESCPNKHLQKAYEDLFYKYGVDLVFSGHEHDYERTYPVYDGKLCKTDADSPYVNPCAPIYIISGSAGNVRGQFIFLGLKPSYVAFRDRDISYTRLTAYNSTDLYMEQVSVDKEGEVIDKVSIHKDQHGPYGKD